LIAIASSPREEIERLARVSGLGYEFLSDPDASVIRAYGLLHAGGGPEGGDISVPANFLVRSDGSIAWRFVSTHVQSRISPDEVLSAVEALDR